MVVALAQGGFGNDAHNNEYPADAFTDERSKMEQDEKNVEAAKAYAETVDMTTEGVKNEELVKRVERFKTAIELSSTYAQGLGFPPIGDPKRWAPSYDEAKKRHASVVFLKVPVAENQERPFIKVNTPRIEFGDKVGNGNIEAFGTKGVAGTRIWTDGTAVNSIGVNLWYPGKYDQAVEFGVSKKDESMHLHINIVDKAAGIAFDKDFESANPIQEMIDDPEFPGMDAVQEILTGVFSNPGVDEKNAKFFTDMINDLSAGHEVDLLPMAKALAGKTI
ncbi:hypothetical protein HN803_00725 [candidate division WWE3 bacterium]|jgi:hypothetical protein|nr:hypothetical protein [candidate division WWE3 bacterium]MBT7349305.1 hypothetical protein [candidate division WWE3 bacterium]